MSKQSRPTGWAVTGQGPKNSVAWKRTEGSAPAGPARVYLQDADLTLYQGDALEVLRGLPDESVHMCVTSPPFYGLRDYGTGRWEGGNDPDCNHRKPFDARSHETSGLKLSKDPTKAHSNVGHKHEAYRDVCGKCGASRVDQQIGLEASPEEWVEALVAVFREVRRVLRHDGTCWIECGDSYASGTGSGRQGQNGQRADRTFTAEGIGRPPPPGVKQKDLIGAPWLLAFALRADGWYLRSDIVWSRPNPMPESVTDRPTKSHSYVFLLSKSARYFFDQEAVRERYAEGTLERPSRLNGQKDPPKPRYGDPSGLSNALTESGRNVRSVWSIATEAYPDAHFATYPQELVRRCILAGTSEWGCCPECGAPWKREVERSESKPFASGTLDKGKAANWKRAGHARADENGDWEAPITLGWRPSCDCFPSFGVLGTIPAKVDPCTVLDPFAGSGTTGLVARKHGRRSILIELSEPYAELIAKRVQQLSLLSELSNG